MALTATIVWEVRADGDDNNGGGYDLGTGGGTDRSQQAAAHATLTTASVVNATTTKITVSAGDYTVLSSDVSNLVRIYGGTATAGTYLITAVDTGANTWTLDRSCGTAGQTVVAKMGGAKASLVSVTNMTTATVGWAAGNTAWVRQDAGDYSLAVEGWVSGGQRYQTGQYGNRIVGYKTTRGDRPTGTDLPKITATASTVNVLHLVTPTYISNLELDGGAQTSGSCVVTNGSAECVYDNMRCSNFKVDGMQINGAYTIVMNSEIFSNASAAAFGMRGGASGGVFTGNWIHDLTVTAITLSTNWTITRNVISNCTGSGSFGIETHYLTTIEYNTIHNCGRHGMTPANTVALPQTIRNNLITDSGNDGTGYGIVGIDFVPKSPHYDYNAFYNNATGEYNGYGSTSGPNTSADYTKHDVTLSGDPYTNAAGDDYRPNNTAGADLWGASSQAFVDIGALQHDPDDDPAAGGGVMGARIFTGY